MAYLVLLLVVAAALVMHMLRLMLIVTRLPRVMLLRVVGLHVIVILTMLMLRNMRLSLLLKGCLLLILWLSEVSRLERQVPIFAMLHCVLLS